MHRSLLPAVLSLSLLFSAKALGWLTAHGARVTTAAMIESFIKMQIPPNCVGNLSPLDMADMTFWQVAWPGIGCARNITDHAAPDSRGYAVSHDIRWHV